MPETADLDEIFDRLEASLRRYAPPLAARTGGVKGKRDCQLWSEKAVEVAGRKRDEVYFAGLIVQKGYVGFYFMPVYTHVGADGRLRARAARAPEGEVVLPRRSASTTSSPATSTRRSRPASISIANAAGSDAMSVRVRFAPSPTGSLHLGNALTAVANRRFADEHGGVLLLRIDDTDPTRIVEGGEDAILDDLRWLGLAWDEGPVRQSERGDVYRAAAERAESDGGAVRDPDGSLRLGGITLLRADGTATYQLATVADDLDLGITHVIRGSDHRPNEEPQRRIARAIGGELPEVIHHGLLLGEDGKKLSKRHGHASVADLRAEGIPAAAVRAYLEELGRPAHDVHLDRARLGRLAIEAIAAMPDDELAAAAGADASLARALRGARTLVEAREIARTITAPAPGVARARGGADARPLRRASGRARAASTRPARARSSASSRRSAATCACCGWRSPAPTAARSCGPSSPRCRRTRRSPARARARVSD